MLKLFNRRKKPTPYVSQYPEEAGMAAPSPTLDYEEYQRCVNLVRKDTHVLHWLCDNTPTIRESNRIWKEGIERAMERSFQTIHPLANKAQVREQVTLYFNID